MNVFCLFSSNYYYSNNGFAKRSIQKKTLKSPCLYDHNLTRKKGNSLKLENANNNKNSENQKRSHGFFHKEKVLGKNCMCPITKTTSYDVVSNDVEKYVFDVYFIFSEVQPW